ncbi:MAG: 30S ribosomal protein S17 [Chlamydiota bacterium]
MKNEERNSRKIREGIVVSNKMQKTVTVRVERTCKHPHFEKVTMRFKKYYAHSENDDIKIGQRVKIVETRPLSKLKRWRVLEIVA